MIRHTKFTKQIHMESGSFLDLNPSSDGAVPNSSEAKFLLEKLPEIYNFERSVSNCVSVPRAYPVRELLDPWQIPTSTSDAQPWETIEAALVRVRTGAPLPTARLNLEVIAWQHCPNAEFQKPATRASPSYNANLSCILLGRPSGISYNRKWQGL